MTDAERKRPPASDQLEVTVLGRGMGECVLCHVGNGRWVMIDSFRDASRSPVGLSYLTQLDGDHRIVAVVATHWDDDHTHGMADVIGRQDPPEVWMPIVLNEREVFRFAVEHNEAMGESAPSGLRDFVGVLRRTHRKGTRRWGIVGRSVDTGTETTMTLLSPTDELVDTGLAALGLRVEPGFGEVTSPTSNLTSIAIWVEREGTAALLGADLEAADVGWTAVVRRGVPGDARASVIKVPHHGSPDADEPRIWSDLAADRPVNAVTRYTRLKDPLPRPVDIQRLTTRAGTVHIAGALPARLTAQSTLYDVHLEAASVGGIRPANGPIGAVRARVVSRGHWQVDAFGSVDVAASG